MLISNDKLIDPQTIERQSFNIRRTLPEQLETERLREIAKDLADRNIVHTQLEEMLLELDAIERRRRAAGNAGRGSASLEECGIDTPVLIDTLGGGVALSPASIGEAALVDVLDQWVEGSVLPLANKHLNQPVVSIQSLGIYACRMKRNESASSLSQHSFGLALDVAGFGLADGSDVDLTRDYDANSDAPKAVFLKAIYDESCQYFSSHLGPEDNGLHENHFHFDVKYRRDGSQRYCRG